MYREILNRFLKVQLEQEGIGLQQGKSNKTKEQAAD